MPANVTPEQLAVIEGVIAQHPEGASLEQIIHGLARAPTERTVRRWLAVLVRRGRVQRIGEARSTRYRTRAIARANELAVAERSPSPTPPPAERAAAMATGNPGVAAPGPAASADLCEQIFAAVIGDIVRYSFSPRVASDSLQRVAEMNIASVDERRACVQLLRARLDGFTEAEALRYGLEPDQYARWRAAQGPVTAPAADTLSSAAPLPAEPLAERAPRAAEPPRAVPAPARSRLERMRPPVRAAVPEGHTSEQPAQVAAVRIPEASDGPEPGVLKLQEAIAEGKRLLTPKRIAISAVWAGALSSAANHLIGGPAASAVTLLAAGVPPLLFVEHDRNAAGRPFPNRDIAAVLIAGGSAGMLCATPVTMIIDSIINAFR